MNQEVLEQLRDVHMPLEPSWWPLAVGYYLVFLLIAIMVFLSYLLYRRLRPARLIKRQLYNEIEIANKDFLREGNVSALQGTITAIIKRILLYKNPDNQGELSFLLDKNTLLSDQKLGAELFSLLTKDRYQKNPEIDGKRLLIVARLMVKKCRI